MSLTFQAPLYAQCLEGDCRNGQGTFRFPEGHIYEGAFVNGQFQGYGRYTEKSGDVYEGIWINHALDSGICRYRSSGNRYEGRFKNGMRHGKGIFYFSDGRRQDGVFEQGAMTQGRLYYRNGDVYDGECRDGKRHGYGILYFADGRMQKGVWVQDTLQVAQNGGYQETYAVIVGIADYQKNDSLLADLAYCDEDARRFYKYLRSPAGGSVPSEHLCLLLDEQAGADSLLAKMARHFARANPNDRVIFFFSGHGSRNALLPYDADPHTQIPFSEIKARFKQCRAKRKLCILDACNSGAIKMMPENIANRKTESENDAQVIIMTSSRDLQPSAEMKALKGGVFSHYLLKGLGGAADQNHDRLVTIRELHQYLHTEVNVRTAGKQSPQTFGNFNNELPIAELQSN